MDRYMMLNIFHLYSAVCSFYILVVTFRQITSKYVTYNIILDSGYSLDPTLSFLPASTHIIEYHKRRLLMFNEPVYSPLAQ